MSDTPLDAGLGFTIDWTKDFVGRAALERQRADQAAGGQVASAQKLVTLHIADESLPIWGAEPILRDGTAVGNVTSAGYAHVVGGQVAFGYVVHPDAAQKGFVRSGTYHVDVGGTLLEAKATLKPLLNPRPRTQGIY